MQCFSKLQISYDLYDIPASTNLLFNLFVSTTQMMHVPVHNDICTRLCSTYCVAIIQYVYCNCNVHDVHVVKLNDENKHCHNNDCTKVRSITA